MLFRLFVLFCFLLSFDLSARERTIKKDFEIERNYDKYSGLETSSYQTLVKLDNKRVIRFSIYKVVDKGHDYQPVKLSREEEKAKLTQKFQADSSADYYIKIGLPNCSANWWTTFQNIGKHVIITLDGNKKIHLELEKLLVFGKSSYIKLPFLNEEESQGVSVIQTRDLEAIIHANKIFIELQGTSNDELTGYFSEKSILSLKNISEI